MTKASIAANPSHKAGNKFPAANTHQNPSHEHKLKSKPNKYAQETECPAIASCG